MDIFIWRFLVLTSLCVHVCVCATVRSRRSEDNFPPSTIWGKTQVTGFGNVP